MATHIKIDVTSRLLHTQQDAVNMLHRSLKRLFGRHDRLLLDRLPRIEEHGHQRYCKQRSNERDNLQTNPKR